MASLFSVAFLGVDTRAYFTGLIGAIYALLDLNRI